MRVRGFSRVAVVVLCVVVGVCLMVVAPAGAVYTHVLTGSIGEAGSGDGQVSLVAGNGYQTSSSGVAVNNVTRDVYVADTGNHRVDEFSASGAFIRAWGWGVADGTTEALQVCTSGCHAGLVGAGVGQLTDPTFIAVDNSNGPSAGDVYVANRTGVEFGEGIIEVVKFTATGGYLSTNNGSSTIMPIPRPFARTFGGIAVDEAGNLWVYAEDPQTAGGIVLEFAQSGSLISEWLSPQSTGTFGLAVSPTHNIYLTSGSQFGKYTASGGLIGFVQLSPGRGAAVNTATGDVYYSSEGESIRRVLSSCDPVVAPCTPTEEFGQGDLSGGQSIAVDPGNDTVYVSDIGQGRVAVFGRTPDVRTEPPADRTPTTAVVSGSVDPDNTPVGECRFDYVVDAEYQPSEPNQYAAGGTVPCDITPSGAGATVVHGEITGLTPGAIYHFRLEATNVNGTTFGADETIAGAAPVIRVVSALGVTSAEARLRATINPAGGVTTYRFEYGPTTGYGTSIPVPDANIGSGTTDVAVAQRIVGLVANTTYHYRLAAHNPLGTTTSADRTITTQASGGGIVDTCPNAAIRALQHTAALPDCRAYEQVSPPERNGAPILGPGDHEARWEAAPDGNSVTYTSAGVFADAQTGGSVVFPYISSRSQNDWSTHSLLPPQQPGSVLPFVPMPAFSADLSKGILLNGGGGELGQDEPALVPGEPANTPNLFLRDNSTNTYQLINRPPSGSSPQFEAGSPDLSHVFFGFGVGSQLYEWSNDAVHLASVLPDGSPAPFATVPSGGSGGVVLQDSHAVSNDGSRVFFQAAGALYLRENGARTVQVDEAHGGGSGGGGEFIVANGNGSVVYFVDDATKGLTGNTAPGSGLNLYRYDAESETLTDLTPVAGAEVQGVIGASEDGSYIYYVANAVLAPVASPGNCTGRHFGDPSTNCSLYLYHNGVTRFIAAVNGEDIGDWDASDAPLFIKNYTAIVSPDGHHLAFQSLNSLTGYGNDAANGRQCGEDHLNLTATPRLRCTEVFLYDATNERLVCASCNPTGVAPIGSSLIGSPLHGASSVPVAGPVNEMFSYQARNLSDAGRLFFNSLDALSPGDVNGQWDVYEYEPAGVGSCGLAQGCLTGMSSGTSPNVSLFRDASLSGEDVFFTTTDEFVAQDGDQSGDLYDARVDGGIASQNAVESAGCEGEGCKPSAAGQSGEQAPGSAAVSGQGNLVPGGPVVVSKPVKKKPKSKPKRKKRRHPVKGRRSRSRRARAGRAIRNRGGAK